MITFYRNSTKFKNINRDLALLFFFFSSRRRHTRSLCDWSSDVCSSDLLTKVFEELAVDHEIIFVNDRSPDDAALVLAELAARDPKVTVINHSRNFGSQSAFTSGMRIATGDAVILLDGDLQDPPELIAGFYQKWRAGFDVVYGVRTSRQASTFLQVAYKAFYRIFRAASYVPMPLDAVDFSLLDRRGGGAPPQPPGRKPVG